MALSRPFTLSSRSLSSTPALRAAAYMLSSKMSHPVNTRSLRPARGTNSLIFGDRPSVRFPRRIVPIWVSEPIGCAMPLRTASTPATNVVATAPMPGIITPSLPFAGSIACPAPLRAALAPDFTSTVATLRAVVLIVLGEDFFTFAISWLLPCRNCGMYANRVCSRIQRTFCKPACPNPQENHLNGVCSASGGIFPEMSFRRSGAIKR